MADPAARFSDLLLDFAYDGEYGTHRLVAGRVCFDDADDIYGIIEVDGTGFERAATLRPKAWKRFAGGLVNAKQHGAMFWKSERLDGMDGDAPLLCEYDRDDNLWVGSVRDQGQFTLFTTPVSAADALVAAILARRLVVATRVSPLSQTLFGARA